MMKDIAILIVLAATLPNNVGTCSFEVYNNKIRTCTTKFIKGLQQNPNEDCKVHLDSFINCSAVAVQACIQQASAKDMRKAMQAQLTEDFMCKKAGLQYPDPSQLNVTFPCNITISEYGTKNNDCTDNLVKKWTADRADPTICSEYHNVKKCLKNTIDKHCDFEGHLLELANYQLDDYNPFCANNVDPTSPTSPATQASPANPTSKVSSSTASKDSDMNPKSKVSSMLTVSKAAIVIPLVVVAVQAF